MIVIVTTDIILNITVVTFVHMFVHMLVVVISIWCTFLVASARKWNDHPVDVTSAPSLLTFRKRL